MEIVSSKPIDPSQVYDLIEKHTAGSVVLHFARVRESSGNKTTISIEFHAARNLEDINEELRKISAEIRRRWQIEDVVIIRRLGQLNIGDIISLVAISSPHRDEAFQACRYGIDRLKEISTIIKKETFA